MAKFKILERFGIELEYMVVDKDTYNIRPIVDNVLKDTVGSFMQEIDRPRINWSNELALHVIEVKNKDPEPDISDMLPDFNLEVKSINESLKKYNCVLMPGGVHPWMNPMTDAKLWPHSNKVIYNTYDRIFGCKGHGWSNLQSMHINISFDGDEDFHRLHSAIRVVLPLIPAMCSSSPVIDGQKFDYMSSRLYHYLKNQRKIESIIGNVVPEAVTSQAEYKEKILNKMYKDIDPFDTDKVLQHEWLNSRGAIAKFKYGCIEIRLADIQEAPIKDLATAEFFTQLIRAFALTDFIDLEKADKISEIELKEILVQSAHFADQAMVTNEKYLDLFGIKDPLTTSELLNYFYEKIDFSDSDMKFKYAVKHNLDQGPLSYRILKFLNSNYKKDHLLEVSKDLSHCLQKGIFFEA
ncbi:MAG: glutamate-cysteine ligase family protein [Bdellovibrionales bacterium]